MLKWGCGDEDEISIISVESMLKIDIIASSTIYTFVCSKSLINDGYGFFA